MNFIFPMGGLSSRFTNAGYKVPKYELDLHGATVFEHAVIGFHRYFADHNFIFAFRGGEDVAEFIISKCLRLGIPHSNLKLIFLNKVTGGQAETVRLAIDRAGILNRESIVVFNIDTFQSVYTFPRRFEIDTVDGYLEVFIGEGSGWSFIEAGKNDSVIRVTEKDRISEYCSSGLYFFKRSGDFCNSYDKMYSAGLKNLHAGERYIAPLYNVLISQGADIRYNLVPSSQLAFSGIPEEYIAVKNRIDLPTSALLKNLAL